MECLMQMVVYVLCQGTTSVVPQTPQNDSGFSPCGNGRLPNRPTIRH